MRAEPWASRWGRGYERAPRFRTEPRGRAPRSRGAERRGIPVRYLEEFRAPAPTAIGRGATGANLGSRSWCPEPEVRHPIRRRLDDAGCVAPPRNSANYSSSSRLASAADPPPTLATDFGSGTLAPRRRAEQPALPLGIAIPPPRGVRAAVHGERDAGHVAGQVRGEEEGGAGDVVGHARPAERHEEAMALALALTEYLREPFRHADVGRDRVDADRVRRQLERHRPGEADDRRLARAVDGVERRRALALDRHDVDDAPAAAPGDHARRDRARAVQDRLQVGAHEGVPALLAGLEEGGAKRPAHVVDQHVDAAEALDGGGDGALDRLPVAHVGGEREDLPAFALDLRGRP